MTRKLSVVTAVGVAALGFGAPAAFGAVHAGGEAAAVLAQPNPVIVYADAHERGLATNLAQSNVTKYRDSFERTAIHSQQNTPLAPSSNVSNYRPLGTSSNVSIYRDAFERAVPPESVPVSVTTSGNDIEWPQIGVGLGIGLLLALGLGLIMRTAHVRPFAH